MKKVLPRKISCLSAMIMFCLSGGAAFADASIVPVGGNVNLAANNVPVVNINQPGQDGVSHNQYSQFDVGSQGAVLNNAQGSAQSQLAGAITANPNLSAGAAKVILNEINSSDKTLLNGMIEVAGQKADVIVANRSGITCNGCGFINTGTGVLTTGELQFKDKQFTGYSVTGGTVAFEGKGLQKGDVDYTAVIARAENINAAVQAKSLLVLAGKKTVTADLTRYINLENKEKSPEVLVDVSQLGGMYAGKIILIANENGVGVNDSTPVSLRNNGELVTDGGDMLLSATSLSNAGKIAAGGNANLATTVLSNQGDITANNALNISATSFSNAKDISAKNNIDIKSTTTSNNGTIVSQQGGVTVSDTTFSNNGTIRAKNNISHKGTLFSNNGTLTSTQGSVFNNGRDINYKPPVVTPPTNSWWSSWWSRSW
ncbi:MULTISPECIES: filamentous hemagglutinin N-terminal domain-containing protein [Serratia]|uniref:Hemolysin n=2 Tax=Serratia TaxID=613 RepID=A0A379ZIE1_9GAMM|nr:MULTISPECIES: filamentous hemagglutinin N-terminal domain-containing protein [Serratia]MCS4268385.1 filamentous hemagglutinin family protein [Serratia sp. BIGb0163]RYM60447.1 filamentous hemagglutinin [Serratia proteamaculans]CAI1108231.1 Hemolysin precursor [Serratia quinivorans]CAI1173021.1 Hemolysin precursor [Serratia quinivorans]CAI1788710.1 Hemolysin precursor [Serratia proteamaculans]